MLTTHEDASVTLNAKRTLVCLEATRELDALAELLPTRSPIIARVLRHPSALPVSACKSGSEIAGDRRDGG